MYLRNTVRTPGVAAAHLFVLFIAVVLALPLSALSTSVAAGSGDSDEAAVAPARVGSSETDAVAASAGSGDSDGTSVVNMEFDQAPVAQVFQSLADAAGLNVLLDDTVAGRITFSLRHIDPVDALDLLAGMTGYSYRIVGNTLVVGTAERLRAQFAAATYDLVRVRSVPLEQARLLVEQLYPELEVIVAETNTLIVRGSGADVAAAAAFLERLDAGSAGRLQFQRSPVETVLWELAQQAGWNLVIEGDVQGELTAALDGMKFVDALGLVGEAARLHYRLQNDVLYVRQLPAPANEHDVRRITVFRLDHVNPVKTADVVTGLFPDLYVDVDEPSRSVIVEGSELTLARVSSFLRDLDVPKRQVIVEARLEEIHVDALESLGVDWSLPGLTGTGGMSSLVLAWDPAQLRAALDLLADQGLSKILASPKLAAIDGESANILIGDRIPRLIKTEDADGRITERLEYIEAGIHLDILATVGQDKSVTMDISTEVSSVTGMTDQNIPQMRTREVSTRVRVQDGQSLVIGGLIEEEERTRLSGLPFLSELPVLGRLFSSQVTENVQTEMVIFLIPHIVHDDVSGGGADRDGARDGGALGTGAGGGSSVQPGGQSGVGAGGGGSTAAGPHVNSDLSIAWLDVGHATNRAVDVQFEGRKQGHSLLSGLYIGDSPHGNAWGVNIGVRRYGRDLSGLSPWAGLGFEYVRPAGESAGGYILSADAGIGTDRLTPLRMELYGAFSFAADNLTLPSPRLPARSEGLTTGLRLGWEY